jgi:hypothetical protein
MAYGLTPSKSKSPKARERDIKVMLSYPNEGGGLTTELLIGVSRVSWFSHLVRQRESDEDSLSRRFFPIFDVNRYANVEAAMYPLPHFSHATLIGLIQSQMA